NECMINIISQSTNVVLTLYILENSLTGSPLPGVSVAVTDAGGNTFSGVTNSSGYLTFTGVPGVWSFTAMKSGYNTKSWSDTITSSCTKYQYLTLSASPVGTIDIFANLNGQPWIGPISYKLTGPEIYNGNNVPQILTNKPTGTYTITYISGGPSNATLQSITPSNTQTLTNGAIIAFTFNFVSQPSATKPSPPRNLRVTGVGDKVINLAWDHPSSNGGSEITNYKIYRGTCSGCETLYITISSSYTTFQNIGANVVNGTTYYYYVTAVNSVGESSPSNEVYATPQPSATKPSPPLNLNAEVVYDSSKRKAGVRISWNPPSNNGGSNITKYNIYRKEESGSYIFIGPRDAQYPYFRDWDVKLGKKYYYKVTAVNSIGESDPSNEKDILVCILVKTTANLNVRSNASLSSSIITTLPPNVNGLIIGGPVFADNYYWWYCFWSYNNNTYFGWSVENYMQFIVGTSSLSLKNKLVK
ncbi:MAG: fibronectin type III domain-containing protein, partial [Caldisericia bacterium]|nr:fibronectin type III domain-containing protein [Caldisericia bacterium]